MEDHSLKFPVELNSILRLLKLPLYIISFLLVLFTPSRQRMPGFTQNLTTHLEFPLPHLHNQECSLRMSIWYYMRVLFIIKVRPRLPKGSVMSCRSCNFRQRRWQSGPNDLSSVSLSLLWFSFFSQNSCCPTPAI